MVNRSHGIGRLLNGILKRKRRRERKRTFFDLDMFRFWGLGGLGGLGGRRNRVPIEMRDKLEKSGFGVWGSGWIINFSN